MEKQRESRKEVLRQFGAARKAAPATRGCVLAVLLCAGLFSGCTVTKRVVSYQAYVRAGDGVATLLAEEGFRLVGSVRERTVEPPLAVRSYAAANTRGLPDAGALAEGASSEHGFSGSHAYGYAYTDTYRYANVSGDTLTYSVVYRTGFAPSKGLVYVYDVHVCGCEVSDSGRRERLCGAASPVGRLDSLPPDTVVVL